MRSTIEFIQKEGKFFIIGNDGREQVRLTKEQFKDFVQHSKIKNSKKFKNKETGEVI
jgi:hypothetical protein